MVTTRLDVAKRTAYGAVFVLGVPLLLLLWARRSAPLVPLPSIGNPVIGGTVALAGLGLMAAGMHALMHYGQGLPMNAFPPHRLVREGVFRWLHDPIYIGFALMILGAALATRSAAGLWLVTPVTWMAMAALVFGYERHDLKRRFGDQAMAPPSWSLPRCRPGTPSAGERVATLVWVFGPWLLAYYAVQALGRPPDAFGTLLPNETGWTVWQWMELPYASAYLFIPLAVLAARSRRALFDFAASGIVATVVVTLCWLVVPVVAIHRHFQPAGWAGNLLAWEQAHSAGVAAFPAFHALWAMLAARLWSAGRGTAVKACIWSWTALILMSLIGTGHHSLLDVATGVLLYGPLRDVTRTWAILRRGGERVANSWREWRAGPVRFINHGLYAGAAAAAGLLIAGSAIGPGQELPIVWVGGWMLVGAGAYAQVLEGSSALLRPFGWYGGLIGGIIGMVTSPLVGGRIIPIMAAFALAAPWIQILGRLRCLVQGCCHGAPASPEAGIRYHHRRSRVAHLAHLAGTPLYPTPLYSIAGNLVLALILIRLHTLAAPDTLLIGVYFILSGCARFVEESYRGEPQTPIIAGLRIYQWFAVGSLLVGVAFTMVPTPPSPGGLSRPSPAMLGWAVVMFVVSAAAMGLDFPASSRRFSRLASAD